ncbi:hypothetical protein ACFVTM_02785 [Arthrobacter sp. NPDC058130]|uniref:hypothetical protein n=1 Tax=Arthrobacter sp. NPDC058130 TaxID=3346353 RepID=UPI0036E350DD
MTTGFLGVAASPEEVGAFVPGDALVPAPDVVMDRGFDLPGLPDAVWPWIVQLGKERSGWYLPRWGEALIPAARRALRTIDPALQALRVGDVIADWGGPGAAFEIVAVDRLRALVHRSQRGALAVSWAIMLRPGRRRHVKMSATYLPCVRSTSSIHASASGLEAPVAS